MTKERGIPSRINMDHDGPVYTTKVAEKNCHAVQLPDVQRSHINNSKRHSPHYQDTYTEYRRVSIL